MAKKNKKDSLKASKKASEEIKDITSQNTENVTKASVESETVEMVEDKIETDKANNDIADAVEDEEVANDVADTVEDEEVADDVADTVEDEEVADDVADAVEDEDVADDVADTVEDEEVEDEEVADDVADTVEDEEVADDVADTIEDEEVADDVADTVEDEEVADDVADTVEDEEVADNVADTIEDEEVADDVADTVEDEEVADDVADTVEDEEVADDVADAVEDEEVADDVADAVEDEDVADDVADAIEDEDIFDIDLNDETDDYLGETEPIQFESDNDESVVDLFEEASAAAQADDEQLSPDEVVDDDDYLDYDDDKRVKRPKKIVSGKTAVITMLFTLVIMIVVTAGIFSFLTYYQKDTGLSIVSYTDRFNKCDTNSFSYSEMLGLEKVSYSDAEMTLTKQDINNLKNGKTVTKFNGMANIKADIRFDKIVSMDFSFSDAINDVESPSGYYMMLAGNVLSGLYPGVDTSDYGFMFAYSVLSYATAVDNSENVYCYRMDDVNFYIDYTEAIKTNLLSKLTIHVESAEPHYIDWSKVDLSWIPWNKDNVSGSDVSASDKK